MQTEIIELIIQLTRNSPRLIDFLGQLLVCRLTQTADSQGHQAHLFASLVKTDMSLLLAGLNTLFPGHTNLINTPAISTPPSLSAPAKAPHMPSEAAAAVSAVRNHLIRLNLEAEHDTARYHEARHSDRPSSTQAPQSSTDDHAWVKESSSATSRRHHFLHRHKNHSSQHSTGSKNNGKSSKQSLNEASRNTHKTNDTERQSQMPSASKRRIDEYPICWELRLRPAFKLIVQLTRSKPALSVIRFILLPLVEIFSRMLFALPFPSSSHLPLSPSLPTVVSTSTDDSSNVDTSSNKVPLNQNIDLSGPILMAQPVDITAWLRGDKYASFEAWRDRLLTVSSLETAALVASASIHADFPGLGLSLDSSRQISPCRISEDNSSLDPHLLWLMRKYATRWRIATSNAAWAKRWVINSDNDCQYLSIRKQAIKPSKSGKV
ncbi:unnamed protein product [Protopolystoma xenopodis]|uniref:Uncharacterized protein n=1 Tax=Protopolystoma xenopodis TaxID=117903 RepID=A0A3S5ATK3_9PLAT|nr:unnamed protein product [Protopolystoma xenopodis]